MPQKLYTASDMGGGLQVVNSPDPVNPQDLATKNYVDNHSGPFVPLWEQDYSMQCGNANFTNGYTHMTTGPVDQTITKLYPDTAIRITGSLTFFVTNALSAQVWLVCGINGQAGVSICGIWPSTVSEHMPLPVGIRYYYSDYIATPATGPMTVAWWLYVSNATSNIATDPNDFAAWTVAECKYA